MPWLELSVAADYEAAEAIAEIFARYGYGSGVVVEPAWQSGDDGPEFRYDPSRPVMLRTYIPGDSNATETRQHLEAALWYLGHLRPIGELQIRSLEEEDWANTWKQHYRVQRVGRRTVIVPSWLEHPVRPDDIVLHLDPGMAFGTGLHPTTRLCLELLEAIVKPEQCVLDLGTGSGILAIAAARLGARRVHAVDNDPLAVEVAGQNIARNQVAGQVQAAVASLGAGRRMGHWLAGEGNGAGVVADVGELADAYDVIVANLIARALLIMVDDIVAVLRPGGLLISSGIILDREAEVAAAFAGAGLRQQERRQEGEWLALVHQYEG
jgi:ribosomal protein L11 methyltransferase